jgi:hypothetical protein
LINRVEHPFALQTAWQKITGNCVGSRKWAGLADMIGFGQEPGRRLQSAANRPFANSFGVRIVTV